ncbi:TonB-dependent receptor domain-containing protein [Methylosinus sporium]|uniref:TonB-dependent receptor domain-containing protein n=1 Tax=Methylosinus sporium TaxID=428 RepID=UPI00383BE5AD
MLIIYRLRTSAYIHAVGVWINDSVTTFETIDATPEKLKEVSGIGEFRANRIAAGWAEQKAVCDIMVFLHAHRVGTSRAARLFRRRPERLSRRRSAQRSKWCELQSRRDHLPTASTYKSMSGSTTGSASGSENTKVAPPPGVASTEILTICDGHYNPPWKGNPTERRFSPNIGILFKLTPEYSFFASYSESFGFSNSAISFDGSAFPPQKGEQWEGGAKASLFDGRRTGSVVYFDLAMSNQLTADVLYPGFSVATGEVRSSGVEFDLAGQNISLFCSYTYDDAIIISDNTTGAGASLGKCWPGVPRNAGIYGPNTIRRRA